MKDDGAFSSRGDRHYVLIDATLSMPIADDSPSSWDVYRKKPIEGGLFFNQEASRGGQGNPSRINLKDWTVDDINQWCRIRGIDTSQPIIVYDQDGGYFSAPRVAFLLAHAGYDVSLIHGGYYALKNSKFHSNITPVSPIDLLDFESINEIHRQYTIIDFRPSADDFTLINRDEIEPSVIPGDNIYIAISDLMDEGPSGQVLKSAEALKAIFEDRYGLSYDQGNTQMMCACNFSVQASIGALALQRSGYADLSILKRGWLPYIKKCAL